MGRKKTAFGLDSSTGSANALVPGNDAGIETNPQKRESFMQYPGKGFCCSRESGRQFTEWYDDEEHYDRAMGTRLPEILPQSAAKEPLEVATWHAGYARIPPWFCAGWGMEHLRGDLGIFTSPVTEGTKHMERRY